MNVRKHRIAGILALSFALAACGQPAPSQTAPQSTDGGYGPFGAAAPAGGPAPMAGGAESVVSGAGGDAPPEFQTLIASYLTDYTGQIAAGWLQVPGVPDVITGLSPGGEHRWQVQLRGEQRYAFIGACDNECSDVDLILEASTGGQIDSDILPDDYPLVEVAPPSDGVYTLRIQLKNCSVAPCYVGARLVRQP